MVTLILPTATDILIKLPTNRKIRKSNVGFESIAKSFGDFRYRNIIATWSNSLTQEKITNYCTMILRSCKTFKNGASAYTCMC